VDDAIIEEIENAAHDYADVRDKRMALTTQEVEAKGVIIGAMKKHGKTHYKRNGIEISLTVEKEKVTVKVVEAEADGDAGGTATDE
jgi:hypothetical protein